MNALRDVAVGHARLAEFKTLVAIDRRIALLDHHHEDIGLRKDFANRRRGMGIRRLCIAAAKSLLLRADHAIARNGWYWLVSGNWLADTMPDTMTSTLAMPCS